MIRTEAIWTIWTWPNLLDRLTSVSLHLTLIPPTEAQVHRRRRCAVEIPWGRLAYFQVTMSWAMPSQHQISMLVRETVLAPLFLSRCRLFSLSNPMVRFVGGGTSNTATFGS
ncbi:hypothetical protein F5B18DRAFT_619497 [Nemania serpens]|nr:hypothetical protein F5B18DRAFT_619497 [Nemania serpens]